MCAENARLRAELPAAAFRQASNLFEQRHWAWSELQKMATALDGIAVDGFPVTADKIERTP